MKVSSSFLTDAINKLRHEGYTEDFNQRIIYAISSEKHCMKGIIVTNHKIKHEYS